MVSLLSIHATEENWTALYVSNAPEIDGVRVARKGDDIAVGSLVVLHTDRLNIGAHGEELAGIGGIHVLHPNKKIHHYEYFHFFLIAFHFLLIYIHHLEYLEGVLNTSDIGSIIRQRRRVLDVDQQKAAELSSVSTHTISDIESGKGNPSIKLLCKVLDALGLEMRVELKQLP